MFSENNSEVKILYYYEYAKINIPCLCPICKCPYNKSMKYSFVYVHEDNNIIYFDVPKCASTVVRKELFDDDDLMSMVNPERDSSEYFKFAFVRNPWDRLVSNWKMFTTHPKRIKQLRAMTDKDLSEFKNFVHFAQVIKNHHWQPQVLYLPEKLNFVGRIENFDEDFSRLCDLIDESPRRLEKLNATKRGQYQEYYTDDLIRVVEKMYDEDISKFGYEFGSDTHSFGAAGTR